MTAAYWEIGRRIVEADRGGTKRADYGEILVRRLAEDLTKRSGRGFGYRNLFQMKAFYLAWPTDGIVQTASAPSPKSFENNSLKSDLELRALAGRFPLPWSAYVRLLSVRKPAARAFYETEALWGGWSVRQLDRQVSSQFYERALLSRNKAALLQREEQAQPGDAPTTEETVRDPFILEFLGLKDDYSELDLEEALILTAQPVHGCLRCQRRAAAPRRLGQTCGRPSVGSGTARGAVAGARGERPDARNPPGGPVSCPAFP